jgi:hypothetical protein
MGLTSTTQHKHIFDEMFNHEVVTPVAPGIGENLFTITSVDNLPAPAQLSAAGQLIKAIHDDVAGWYCGEYGKSQMDTYQLGEALGPVRDQFVNHPRFNQVLELLQIDCNEAKLI